MMPLPFKEGLSTRISSGKPKFLFFLDVIYNGNWIIMISDDFYNIGKCKIYFISNPKVALVDKDTFLIFEIF